VHTSEMAVRVRTELVQRYTGLRWAFLANDNTHYWVACGLDFGRRASAGPLSSGRGRPCCAQCFGHLMRISA